MLYQVRANCHQKAFKNHKKSSDGSCLEQECYSNVILALLYISEENYSQRQRYQHDLSLKILLVKSIVVPAIPIASF